MVRRFLKARKELLRDCGEANLDGGMQALPQEYGNVLQAKALVAVISSSTVNFDCAASH